MEAAGSSASRIYSSRMITIIRVGCLTRGQDDAPGEDTWDETQLIGKEKPSVKHHCTVQQEDNFKPSW